MTEKTPANLTNLTQTECENAIGNIQMWIDARVRVFAKMGGLPGQAARVRRPRQGGQRPADHRHDSAGAAAQQACAVHRHAAEDGAEVMSDIDRQRVAAVRVLEEIGYAWEDGRWKPKARPSVADAVDPLSLNGALIILAAMHTDTDASVGFMVSGVPRWSNYSMEHYVEAWRVVRKHLGMPT